MHTDVPPAALRRHRVTTVHPLTIDHEARTARVHGVPLEMRRKEWDLLVTLAAAPDRVFTKAELLRAVWNIEADSTTRTLDTHACRLRATLREAGADMLVTVWGVGYRLRKPA